MEPLSPSSSRLFRVFFSSIVVILAMAITSSAHAARKALVIGVSEYEHSRPLVNPTNDANAFAEKLLLCGFQVTKLIDPTYEEMRKELRKFSVSLGPEDEALFYFAGHGIQVNNASYLIPSDSDLGDPNFVDQVSISLDAVLSELDNNGQGARMKFVILDCCRDEPFGRSWRGPRTNSGGLAVPSLSSEGIVLCFATDPGSTASDGEGDNSPYTAALLKHLFTPGIDFQQALMSVGSEVKIATSDTQNPWRNSNLNEPFYLIPGSPRMNQVPMEDLEKGDAQLANELLAALNSSNNSALPAALQTVIADLGDVSADEIPDLVQARIEVVCFKMALAGSWESDIDQKLLKRISEPPFNSSFASFVFANEQLEVADLMIADGLVEEANAHLKNAFELLDKGIEQRNSISRLKKGSLLTRHYELKYKEVPGVRLPGTAEEGFSLLQDAYSSFRSKHLEKRIFGPAGVSLPFDDEACEAQAAMVIAQCWHHGIGTGKPYAFDPTNLYYGKQSGKKAIDYYEKVLALNPELGEARAGLLELQIQQNDGFWTDEMIQAAKRGAELDDAFCKYHYALYLWRTDKAANEFEVKALMRESASDTRSLTFDEARQWLSDNE